MVPTRSRGVMGEGLDVCDTRLMLPFMAARLALVSDASGHPRTCARCWPHVAAYLRDHHGDARESMGPVACPVLPRCYHSCYHVPAKWGHPGAIRSYQKEFAFVWLISGIHWISAAFHHSWPILYGEKCIPSHSAARKIAIIGIPCDFTLFPRGLAVSGMWLRPGVLPWPRRGPIS